MPIRWWVKIDAYFNDNDRIRAVGRDGWNVFFHMLCLNGAGQFDGLIPARFIVPRLIGVKLDMTTEEVRNGLDACLDPEIALLELKENGDLFIPGYDEEWKPKASTSAERKRKEREKKKAKSRPVTNRDVSQDNVTVSRDSHAGHVEVEREREDYLPSGGTRAGRAAEAQVPLLAVVTPPGPPPAKRATRADGEATDPRVKPVGDRFAELHLAVIGKAYQAQYGRDGKVLRALPTGEHGYDTETLLGLLEDYFADRSGLAKFPPSVPAFCARVATLWEARKPRRAGTGYHAGSASFGGGEVDL